MPQPQPQRTRAEIELALDSHRLQTLMYNGEWCVLRRNGKTQTWKKFPYRFRIPVKYGLRGYGAIDDMNLNGDHLRIVPESAESVSV